MSELKTKYKWIQFEQAGKEWLCGNHTTGDYLGEVVYDSGWRQHVFEPNYPVKFNTGCLKDIAHFLNQLN